MSAIRKLIHDMRLMGMAATLDKTTATAVEEKWGYSEVFAWNFLPFRLDFLRHHKRAHLVIRYRS